uniref:Uncharacterized protein n=1 Tax=Brassica campestris TaxID=3711 RepID=M4DZJ7_BRACM
MSESQTAPRSQPQSSSSSAWKDAVEEACERGIGAIAEPGGNIRDQDNKYGVSLLFTNVRHISAIDDGSLQFCSYKDFQETLKT